MDSPSNERVIQIFNLINMSSKGRFDWLKYHGRSRSMPKMSMVTNAIANRLIEVFGNELAIQQHISLLVWFEPSTYVRDIANKQSLGITSFSTNLLTDASHCATIIHVPNKEMFIEKDGQPAVIFLELIGKRMDPVAFVALCRASRCHEAWKSDLWLSFKTRATCLVDTLELEEIYVRQFAKKLHELMTK